MESSGSQPRVSITPRSLAPSGHRRRLDVYLNSEQVRIACQCGWQMPKPDSHERAERAYDQHLYALDIDPEPGR
jgi:hypothetical protein